MKKCFCDFSQVLCQQLPTYEKLFNETAQLSRAVDEVADRQRMALNHGTGKYFYIHPLYECYVSLSRFAAL